MSYLWAVRLTIPPNATNQLEPYDLQTMIDDVDHTYHKVLFLMPVKPRIINQYRKLPAANPESPKYQKVETGEHVSWSFNKLDLNDDMDESDIDAMNASVSKASNFVEQFASYVLDFEQSELNGEASELSEPNRLLAAYSSQEMRNARNECYRSISAYRGPELASAFNAKRVEVLTEMSSNFSHDLNEGEAIRTLILENGGRFSSVQEGEMAQLIHRVMILAATKLYVIDEVETKYEAVVNRSELEICS